MFNKLKVRSNFDSAAQSYDLYAGPQKLISERLAERILRAVPPTSRPIKILEIGCGTGFLTEQLLPFFPNAEIVVSDVSESMVKACKEKFADSKITPLVMDGELPSFKESSFDLIVSSLTLQWFGSTQSSLAELGKLLRPGGQIFFSTLGERSFQEIREIYHKFSLRSGFQQLETLDGLNDLMPDNCHSCMEEEELPYYYTSAISFMRSIKQIGASTPVASYVPLSLRSLKLLIQATKGPCALTYHVLYGVCKKAHVQVVSQGTEQLEQIAEHKMAA